MRRYDDDLDFGERSGKSDLRRLIPITVVAVLFVIVAGALFILNRKEEGPKGADAPEFETGTEAMAGTAGEGEKNEAKDTEDKEDPQSGAGSMSGETGADVDVTELLSAGRVNETAGLTLGVDVAKYQGTIDWAKVADAGIDFVMVRVGYRTMTTGEICADTNAKYNMQEAQAYGIKVGAYFFSTAITEEEAIEEADWVAEYISRYKITYPVAYNCEGFDKEESRQYNLTQEERSSLAMAFMDRIYEKGYTPMFYASRNELLSDAKWDTSRIEMKYRIWVSQYPDRPYPETASSDYTGVHAMWQYTNQGNIAGIDQPVDVNVAYFSYDGTADALSDAAPETVGADVEALMAFSEISETVTAKEKTNLRDIPSQGEESSVIMTLVNGETAERTGISDSGWSRIIYGGKTYYAVSDYLTTDLSHIVPDSSAAEEGAGSGDGLKTKFTAVNDVVTAKIEVNLRALPSVTNPDAAVVAVLHNGETVTRTGVNNDYGWSRVDYNGQTLYCITSYLTGAQ